MRLTLTIVIFFCVAASSAGASPRITKTYKYFDGLMAAQDTACIAAVVDHLVVDYDGLNKIELGSNSIFSTANGYLATYAGAKFEGRYGSANGTINCIFASDGRTLTDVSITFEDRGLAGYKGKAIIEGSTDPSQQRKTAISKTLVP